jgi:hypothetical protein
MMKPKLIGRVVLLVSALAVRAQAQTVELSVGVGGANVTSGSDWWGRGVHSPAVDGKVGFAFNDRFAIESFVTYGHRSVPVAGYAPFVSGGDTQITEGLYGVVVRQRVVGASGSRFHAFVSYGLGGVYSRESAPARQYQYGRTVVALPAYTNSQTQGMWFPVGGFAVQQEIASHLAIRAEGQVVTFFGIPIGGRGSVGLVVPIGGSSATASRR